MLNWLVVVLGPDVFVAAVSAKDAYGVSAVEYAARNLRLSQLEVLVTACIERGCGMTSDALRLSSWRLYPTMGKAACPWCVHCGTTACTFCRASWMRVRTRCCRAGTFTGTACLALGCVWCGRAALATKELLRLLQDLDALDACMRVCSAQVRTMRPSHCAWTAVLALASPAVNGCAGVLGTCSAGVALSPTPPPIQTQFIRLA